MLRARRAMPVLFNQRAYYQKVRSLGPIAYWPLYDAAGSLTAVDLMGLGNGTLGTTTKAPTLGVAGIGDGKTACSFDGGDYIDIYSAALASAFNAATGTLSVWAKVADVGVWTDGAVRSFAYMEGNSSNRIAIRKNTNNNVQFLYVAGGTADAVNASGMTSTGWLHFAMTWKTADGGELIAYLNGTQVGTTQTGLGTWAVNFNSVNTCIGASATTPAEAMSGTLAHVALFTKVLTPVQIRQLANP